MAICSAFKSETSGDWEAGEPATAWVLTPEGVMVTNYHVFAEAAKEEVFGVMSRDGGFFPVTEILAADKLNDVAIFKIHAKGLQPLALGADEAVGKRVAVISHPDSQFYTFTQGHITRYTMQYDSPKSPPVKYMSITADYARGSSGGPVLNDHGAVVGMVCSTRTTYYGEKNKEANDDVQMIVKYCVPGESIRALLKATPGTNGKTSDKSAEAKVKPATETPEEKTPASGSAAAPPKAEPVPEPSGGQP
jgi:S1-C subfamily serine protease